MEGGRLRRKRNEMMKFCVVGMRSSYMYMYADEIYE